MVADPLDRIVEVMAGSQYAVGVTARGELLPWVRVPATANAICFIRMLTYVCVRSKAWLAICVSLWLAHVHHLSGEALTARRVACVPLQ